jgi:hypothetical protein
MRSIEEAIVRLEEERKSLEPMLHIKEGAQEERLKTLDRHIDMLLTKRRVLEEGARYGAKSGLRGESSQAYEEMSLRVKRNFYVTLSVLGILLFSLIL